MKKRGQKMSHWCRLEDSSSTYANQPHKKPFCARCGKAAKVGNLGAVKMCRHPEEAQTHLNCGKPLERCPCPKTWNGFTIVPILI